MTLFSQYKEAVAFLESLNNLVEQEYYSKIEAQTVYHTRMRAFLALLDNPQDKLKYVHVTGTSGKGSTTKMCASILQAAGNRVGLFQSPHLSTFAERITINDQLISMQETIDLLALMKEKVQEYLLTTEYSMLSYGELCFCMALYHYAKQQCDYVVVEVACGGRADYTNVIPHALVTIITNIGNDHMHILGPTLADVAYAKAGIIKKDSQFFTTETNPEFLNIFKQECETVDAAFNQLHAHNITNVTLHEQASEFTYQGIGYTVNLPGQHQIHNALLAIEMAHHLRIDQPAINDGLKNLRFPGRMEILQHEPLVILDSAHNDEKLSATFRTLETIKAKHTPEKVWVIFAFTSGKNIQPIVEKFLPNIDNLIITRHNHVFRKAIHPREILRTVRDSRPDLEPKYFLEPLDAVEHVLRNASKNDMILITGSLYMSGIARTHWISEETIMNTRSYFPE